MSTFIPYLESHLAGECKQPIFARISTHHMRQIMMSKTEYESKDHLEFACLKVRKHYAGYELSSICRRFPVDRYHYFIAPELALHISTKGKVLGIFPETECKPSFILSG